MIHVKTVSGSLFVLNLFKQPRYWERRIEGSVGVRTITGALWNFPSIHVGKPMIMMGPPLTPGADVRYIETTPVTSIEWKHEAGNHL